MSVHIESFRKLIRRIYNTQDEELDCDALLERLPQYVDLEVAGEDVGRAVPEVNQHLAQCDACQDMYLTLRDAASLESQEAVPELVRVRRSR